MSRRQYQDGVDLARPQAAKQSNLEKQPQRRFKKQYGFTRFKHLTYRATAAVTILLLILSGVGYVLYHKSQDQKVVPERLAKQVSFPIYYPDPKKLPAGYEINKTSFTSPAKDVVLYSVDYSGGKLIFSVQPKPPSSDLANFNSQRIPLHTEVDTPSGKATIGAIGQQSVVSLPTNSNAWIIVTGPYATDQQKEISILKNLRSTN